MTYSDTIGVMDSGVGGLTVLSELIKVLPSAKYIYLGDTANLPYGCKTKEEILFFNRNILNFFLTLGVKDIAIACNTTSALTYEDLREEFSPKGLRIFPLIQSAAYSATLGLNDGDCICVLSTLATAKSGKYASEINKIKPNLKVVEIPCPNFVEIVENRLYDLDESKKIVREKMKIILENKAKRVILGCTHYPYLLDMFSLYLPREIFFNPAGSLAKNICSFIKNTNDAGDIDFYVTGDPCEFKKSAKLFFDIKKEVKSVKMPTFSRV